MKLFLRNIRLKLGKWLLDTKKAPMESHKVIFLRQDGKIGDYIVSSFVFRELKKSYPQMEIGVVYDKRQAYLLRQNPYIDSHYVVRNKNVIDYIKCGLKLRKQKYDTVIDPTILIRNRDLLLLRLINANNYVGYQKSDYRIFNMNLEGDYHFSELYQLALEKIGITVDNTQYDIPLNSISQQEIISFLHENKLSGYLTLNFYGAARSRKFEDHNAEKMIRYLQEKTHKPIVLLSSPDTVEKLKLMAEKYHNVFVFDTKNIFHTIELIRYSEMLISPDTSTIHIASGLNKRIIGFYHDNKQNFINWKPTSKAETHVLFYKENINEISPEQIKAEWLSE